LFSGLIHRYAKPTEVRAAAKTYSDGRISIRETEFQSHGFDMRESHAKIKVAGKVVAQRRLLIR
jgi:hypothetical protein